MWVGRCFDDPDLHSTSKKRKCAVIGVGVLHASDNWKKSWWLKVGILLCMHAFGRDWVLILCRPDVLQHDASKFILVGILVAMICYPLRSWLCGVGKHTFLSCNLLTEELKA